MYNLTALQKKLFGSVGIKQTRNPIFGILPPDLTESRTGIFVDDAHRLLTKENIHASINLDEYEYYPAWVNGIVYNTGEKVTHKGQIYESLTGVSHAEIYDNDNNTLSFTFGDEGNTEEPGTGAAWRAESVMGIYLRETMQTAIAEVLNRVFTDNKLQHESKAIFQNTQLFQVTGSMYNKVIKAGRFVGVELGLKQTQDITLRVSKIGLQIDRANPDFTLYLFRGGIPGQKMQFLMKWEFIIDKPGYFQWFFIDDLPLNYMLDGTEGSFLFGYFENDFVGQAIAVERDLLKGPCLSCSNYDKEAYKAYSEFVDVHPFSVNAYHYDGLEIEYGMQGYHYNTNFGINLAFTAECDVTDFIIRNQRIFSTAIQKAAAISLLNGIAYSTQNKGELIKIKDLARYDLDNKPEHTLGLRAEYEKLLKGIQFDMSGLNSRCLPCAPKRRIKHGTVGAP